MKAFFLFIAKAIASLFGVGYLRPFSATWGSAVIGIVLYYTWPGLNPESRLDMICAIFILGFILAEIIERLEKIQDPSFVVIDEIVGMMVSTYFLQSIWWQWVLAFFLFRFFDILKPWPASWLDHGGLGGFGVMMDDVVAGVYSFTVLSLILSW